MSKRDVQLLKSPGLAERVIDLLAQKQPLPAKGLLAGQAVASAIDEILGTGLAVYNDIDIFLEDAQWALVTDEVFPGFNIPYKRRVISPVKFEESPTLTLVKSEYVQAFSIATRTTYQVVKAERDELLNLVLVRYGYQAPVDRATCLIEGFDLNNIQVAVNLETRKLTYTKHFESYFEGRELRIVNVFTPFASLLRYFKKRGELNAYGNDDLHVELTRRVVYANEGDPLFREDRIQAFTQGERWIPKMHTERFAVRGSRGDLSSSMVRTGTGIEGLPLAIGKKYEALLQQWLPQFAPYFEVWKHPRANVWLLTSRPDAPRLPYIGELETSPTLVCERFRELGLPQGRLVENRRKEFWKFSAWLTPKLQTLYREAYQHHGEAFLVGAESQQGWRELQAILNEHDEVVSAVITLPLGEQIDIVRRVKTILKKLNAPEAWGIFQGKDSGWIRKGLADGEWLRKEIASTLGSLAPLVPADRLLPLPAELDNTLIRELNSSRELVLEGARMHHCVGGYGDAVAKGESRIISLCCGPKSTDCSTLELRRVFTTHEPRQVRVQNGQNYTFGNRYPSEHLEAVADTLIRELNRWFEENPEEGVYRMCGTREIGPPLPPEPVQRMRPIVLRRNG